MKLLIIGCGSIGTRHARNIQLFGHSTILFDSDKNKSEFLAKELKAEQVENLEKGIDIKPDAALICTPPNLHIEQAIKCIDNNIPIFIEKPLSNNLNHIEELINKIENKKILNTVACNMRFSEGFRLMKNKITELENILWVNVEFGYDLRKWRPYQDHKKSYSASREQGGGIVIDSIHELDYSQDLFGKPIYGIGNILKTGTLDIETEDCADFLIKTEKCSSIHIHLDYLQPKYTRKCTIVGKNGIIKWKLIEGVYYCINGREEKIKIENDLSKMYVNEIKYFLNSLEEKKEMVNCVKDSAEILHLALELRDKGKYKTDEYKKGVC